MPTPDSHRAALPTGSARPAGRGRRPGWIVLGVLLAVLLAAGGFTGYYYHRLNQALSGINRSEGLLPREGDRPASPTPKADEERTPINYLLIGTDARGADDPGRSDVLMVAHLSADRKNLYLISFPRDMWVPIPEHGMAKINAAYAYGGAALTAQTLEDLLDVRMDHAALIDFEGFSALTTAIGGVDVYNKYASSSRGYDFPEGTVHLEGDQALAYVRERQNLPHGDLDRAERQRDVVRAILAKVATPQVLGNPVALGEVMDTFSCHITVDSGLTNAHILDVSRELGFSGADGVRSLQVPIAGLGTSDDGQSIVLVDELGLEELGEALRADSMEDYLLTHG